MLRPIRKSMASFYNSISIPALRRRVREQDQWLLLRQQTIRELERLVVEREGTVVERERAVVEREHTAAKRERTILELEARLEKLKELGRSNDDRSYAVSQRLDLPNASSGAATYPEARATKTPEELSIALAQWKEVVAAGHFVQFGAQSFIDPYIVFKRLAGAPTYILISTFEGLYWYDKFDLTDVPYLHMLGMIRPGDVVIDCGSNQGINSLAYSRIIGATGHVHAFDPYPINCAIAKFNAKINDRENITIHQKAVSNREDILNISVGTQDILDAKGSADAITATAVTIDSFELKPNFIKIDVEGAEINALEGAAETVRKFEPYIYLESHHPAQIARFGRRVDEIFDIIDLRIYNCLIIYPGQPLLVDYTKQFDLDGPCQMFFLPKSAPPPVTRFF
jgi:FkbM family methyltransferase